MSLRRVLTSMVLHSACCQPIVDCEPFSCVTSHSRSVMLLCRLSCPLITVIAMLVRPCKNGNCVVEILLSAKYIPGFVQIDSFDCRMWYSRTPPRVAVCYESVHCALACLRLVSAVSQARPHGQGVCADLGPIDFCH